MKEKLRFLFVFFVVIMILMTMTGCREPDPPNIPYSAGSFGTQYTPLPNGTDGTAGTSAKYVLFGDWPQSLKSNSVTIDSSKQVQVGAYTYYWGSDDFLYAKKDNKYYKVEPIKWRVLTDNYNGTGNRLLLAENILINCAWYNNLSERVIDGNDVNVNNYLHSRIRAFLNGISYKSSSNDNSSNREFVGKGFLQTAFTAYSWNMVMRASVSNGSRSTNPEDNMSLWDDGNNSFSCNDTSDEVFLLSEQEATNSEFRFLSYDDGRVGSNRIRLPTDFAKANGAWQSNNAGHGGYWWLRSPDCSEENKVHIINEDGDASLSSIVNTGFGGVVPAVLVSSEYVFHDSVSYLPDGMKGTVGTSGKYALFGDWPQSKKASGVTIYTSESMENGMFTYYKGSDGCWYVQNGNSYRDIWGEYFKVEPLKWRVLTDNYNGTGKKLLLAEDALINCEYYDDHRVGAENYIGERIIDGVTIYPNNYCYSKVRAFLNGLVYNRIGITNDELLDKGFLQTAFTIEGQNRIAITNVNNSARSTNPDTKPRLWDSGYNEYACSDTNDKIFLLSEQEVTSTKYGFAVYDKYDRGKNRVVTDFAKKNGLDVANQYDIQGWWLRSPLSNDLSRARCVVPDGYAYTGRCSVHNGSGCAVVPALCIDN